MKTRIVTKCASRDPECLIENAPYTLIGNTCIPNSFQITLKAGGLKKMLKGLCGEDIFRIEVFPHNKLTEFSFIKNNGS